MNFFSFKCLLILSVLLFVLVVSWDEQSTALVSAQRGKRRDSRTKSKKKKKKKRRKPKKGKKGRGRGGRGRKDEEEEEVKVVKDTRIKCFVCSADWTNSRLDPTDLCYDPYQNESLATEQFMVSCSQPTKYCNVEITTINYAFTGLKRGCGSQACAEYCLINGFGLDYTSCLSCCPESGSAIRLGNQTTTPNPDDEDYELLDSDERTTTTLSPDQIVYKARLKNMIANRNCA